MTLSGAIIIEDGGPAFPQPHLTAEDGASGMTLRDYYAGEALKGMLANAHPSIIQSWGKFPNQAFTFADAMLKARKAVLK